jgi:hypothetical protein
VVSLSFRLKQSINRRTLKRENTKQGFVMTIFRVRIAAISPRTAPGVALLRRKRTFQNHFPIFHRSSTATERMRNDADRRRDT